MTPFETLKNRYRAAGLSEELAEQHWAAKSSCLSDIEHLEHLLGMLPRMLKSRESPAPTVDYVSSAEMHAHPDKYDQWGRRR